MSVRFVKGGTSEYIQNPILSNRYILDAFQSKGRTAGGELFVYDKAPDEVYKLALTFAELRDSEKEALESFFVNDAEGMLYTFTYTDHEGTTWTARFLTPVLEFTSIADKRASTTSFTSGGVTYPTTVREESIWSVEFELEVVVIP